MNKLRSLSVVLLVAAGACSGPLAAVGKEVAIEMPACVAGGVIGLAGALQHDVSAIVLDPGISEDAALASLRSTALHAGITNGVGVALCALDRIIAAAVGTHPVDVVAGSGHALFAVNDHTAVVTATPADAACRLADRARRLRARLAGGTP